MQLYAQTADQQPVFANRAKKQCDYFCLECNGLVRLRGGLHRQNHFYHIQPTRDCRQNGKTLEHLQVQCFLKNTLPTDECFLEHRFPSINRIADAAWLPQKLIFEVQCSPITAQEIYRRNKDYGEIGYNVVWILHDRRFNHYRATSAELFLQNSSSYFTNMNEEGIGIVYDQLSIFHKGCRYYSLPPLPLAISYPLKPPLVPGMPSSLIRRCQNWKIAFPGDLISRLLQNPKEAEMQFFVDRIRAAEQELEEPRLNFLGYLERFTLRPYKLFLQMLLERHTL